MKSTRTSLFHNKPLSIPGTCSALLAAGLLFLGIAPAQAAAPANDLPTAAEMIPASGPFPYLSAVMPDITGATSVGDPQPPTCQPNVSRSIWYRFQPTVSGRYVFTTAAGAPTATTVDDTVLAIFTADSSIEPFVEIACDDDAVGTQSLIQVDLVAGTRYWIAVYKWESTMPLPGRTAVQLRVDRPPANNQPPNAGDDLAGTVEGQSIQIPVEKFLANDRDPNGDPLAITGVNSHSESGGSQILQNGVILYTPPSGFVGEDRFAYYVTDNHGGIGIGVVTIVVTPANAPTLNIVSVETLSGGRNRITFSGIPGRPYEMQTSPGNSPWQRVGVVTPAANGLAVIDDPSANGQARSYRTSPVLVVEATSAAGATLSFAPLSYDPVNAPSYSRPSGSLFPLGTTFVNGAARYESGQTARFNFSVIVLGPRSLLGRLESDLSHYDFGGDKSEQNKYLGGIKSLRASLVDTYWTDDVQLTPKSGDKVFDGLRSLVKSLGDAQKGKNQPADPFLLEATQRAVRLSRILAEAAVNSVGADAKKSVTKKAQRELEKAENDAIRGRLDSSIQHFGEAWKAVRNRKK